VDPRRALVRARCCVLLRTCRRRARGSQRARRRRCGCCHTERVRVVVHIAVLLGGGDAPTVLWGRCAG
jgi:hypothetical protein